jgi:hypothetical protein
MAYFLRSLTAQGLDQFTELSGRHVVMIGPVFSNDRSQGAGAQTVDMFDGEQTVRRDFAGFDPKLTYSLFQEKAGASDMAGRAHAHDEVVFTAGFQFEGLVKGRHPADFHERHAKSLGRSLHGLFGYVTVVFLNIVKYFNELIRLTATSFQDLLERLGRHVNLL